MKKLSPSSSQDRLAVVYKLTQEFNSSLELDKVLNNVMDEVIQSLHAERGFLLLVDMNGNLTFHAARNIDHETIRNPSFQISRSIVERVQREKEPILTIDAQKDDRFYKQQSIVAKGLHSILCVPIKNQETLLGIIYIDNSLTTAAFNEEDRELLKAIAASASIAIQNASLFDNLEHSKKELEIAYEETLEGWARALELRDQVTEGHTRRVTDMAIRLAQRIGITGEQLSHIRRGSILHDIGKMGIPDSVLLKPDYLTPDEYEIMKKHTVYAYEMLSPIAFLRPAIDIPYSHHERWNGTGYPCGLKGNQIPLAARVFAIVDVWDALRSQRPYRQGWSEDRIIRYLSEYADILFDPNIIQHFIQLITNAPFPTR